MDAACGPEPSDGSEDVRLDMGPLKGALIADTSGRSLHGNAKLLRTRRGEHEVGALDIGLKRAHHDRQPSLA
jgi:hypothetical protein